MEHLARAWTAGAVDHIDIITITNPHDFLQTYPGRKIGTLVNPTAEYLNNFHFEPDDLLIFGSEKEGLDPRAIDLLDAAVYIPQRGHTDCLNVAVTFGIVVARALA